MPTPQEMRYIMQRYLERVAQHNAEGVVELFSDDISVEDPVGGPAGSHVIGRDAVLTFFRTGFARSRPRPELTGAIRTTCGDEAAMPFLLRLELRGEAMEVDVIDVMTFDTNGKISSLRAIWDPDELRPAGRGSRRRAEKG
jgi:steroid delta-isomerase